MRDCLRTGEMTQGVQVTIRHVNEWMEGKHGLAFLCPLLDGFLLRNPMGLQRDTEYKLEEDSYPVDSS